MASHSKEAVPTLKLPPIAGKLPLILTVVGLVLGGAAFVLNKDHGRQLAYSYLTAYMFFLSLVFGGLFLVLIHHLFDAYWTVPLRRITENLAMLAPVMFVLWLPIVGFAFSKQINLYPWFFADPHVDHALHAKLPLFTHAGWMITITVCFAVWTFLAWKFRSNTTGQDKDGAAKWTLSNRIHAGWGIFAFAGTGTFLCFMLMKSLMHQFFSTMYGVYYFAGSVWLTYGTLYIITMLLQRTGPLRAVVTKTTFHDIGKMFFAFTVFYAYITFSQYFLIWNANMPEETFWFVRREVGSWYWVGILMIFGHFFLPFLVMLRQDAKRSIAVIGPVVALAWVIHYMDMQFNIMPVLHRENFVLHYADIGCMAFIGGVLTMAWLKLYAANPPYPQKDPRMAECMGVYVEPLKGSIAAAHLGIK
jgi:hypothetical protein